MKHQLQLNDEGRVDLFAFEIEGETCGHAGPQCVVCFEPWCQWCEGRADPKPWLASECPGAEDDQAVPDDV